MLDADRDAVVAFLDRHDREPAPWRDAMSLDRSAVWLTPHECEQLRASITARVERVRRRHPDLPRPPTCRRVHVSWLLVPLPEPADPPPPPTG